MTQLVVQFPHSGKVHLTGNNNSSFGKVKIRKATISSGYIPWNDGDHWRKFFFIKGNYIDSVDLLIQGKNIYFWGEWEAPSKFNPIACSNFNYQSHYAHNELFAHDPASYISKFKVIVPNLPNGFAYPLSPRLQNTDPYVFGKHFIYSICKQTGKLKKLSPGSVILFGSCINQCFVLDTVFVVADTKQYSLEEDEDFFNNLIKDGWISETFYNVTIRALQLDPFIKNRRKKLMLYKGATYSNPVHGMYSFFPCSVDGCFSRPEINNIDISPRLNTGKKFLNLTPKDVWSEAIYQVRNRKLLLGVYAQEPLLSIP